MGRDEDGDVTSTAFAGDDSVAVDLVKFAGGRDPTA